MEGMESLCG